MRKAELCTLVFAILFFSSNITFAQEQLGLKLENYSGINSVLLNPTNQLTSPLKWNVNIVSAGVFLDNNYAFLEDASLFTLIRRSDEIRARPDIDPEIENINNFLILDFYDGNNKKRASALATVMGPSVMVNLQSGWSFGLFTNFRTAVSTRKIPASLSFYRFDSQEELENFSVSPFKAGGMAWGELGFNVARRIETITGTIGVGINAKYLYGTEAIYFNNNTTFDMAKLGTESADFQNIDVTYGYTNSIANDENYKIKQNGRGLGLDIGVSYIDGYKDGDYDWKVGAAIVDIGRIRFRQNAESHRININSSFLLDFNDYENLPTISDQSDLLSLQILNDATASLEGTNFNMSLPTALTAYGDYHFTKNVYLNALLVQSVPIGENVVARDNLLAITPRYERQWFGVMMPVSLLNYQQLRMGLSARIAFLTIGTEDLGSMFKQSLFNGSDFYVGVRFNPFEIGKNGSGNGLFGKRKGVGCVY